jgi:predicted esterase
MNCGAISRRLTLCFGIGLLIFTPTYAAERSAPPAIRYEAGRRLRQFESSWSRTNNPAARHRAIAPLKQAVNQFLGGKQLEAARSLDDARLALESADDHAAELRWAESLFLDFPRRLADADSTRLPLTLRDLYDTGFPLPKGAEAKISVARADGKQPVETSVLINQLPCEISLSLSGLGEGDFTARLLVRADGEELASGEYRFSLVKNLAARLSAVVPSLDFTEKAQTIDGESAAALVKLISGLAGGDMLETDYPAARLLTELEQLAMAIKSDKAFYNGSRAGQFWLRVPVKGQPLPVRILVPAGVEGRETTPIVVALHGAGGSENLFFDGYGQGAIIEQCRSRGWMVVSPRTEGFGLLPVQELVEALAKNYPLDSARVFLVGHSMGALQVTAAVQAHPDRYAAVAALGGGGVVKPSEPLKRLPYFVAVGSEDFALGGVERLVANLRKAGAERLEFREYPDVEHLLIVQESLPEVFRFFDDAMAQRK